MKISNIERSSENRWIFKVTFEPNWIEKLFGIKPFTREFKQTDDEYTFGSGSVYLTKSGKKLGNGNWVGEAIDNYRRQW